MTLDSLRYIDNIKIFTFKHTITELCTAVKPMAALEIIERYHANSVIYLDPDIAVFNSLEKLEKMFDQSSILLTPHQLKPETNDLYIRENEILFLKRGCYNFGFFGVKADEEGIKFLNWWRKRLKDYCFDDNYECLSELSRDGLLGMFTDQKWADLIPCFFENYFIIRHPGYNVCTWNLTQRHLEISPHGEITVDGEPLYFFHFSGFDSGGHHNELQKLLSFDPQNRDVEKLSKWYEAELKKNGQKLFSLISDENNKYSNGEYIQDFERKIFHIRKDIYDIFQDPYYVNEENCYFMWIRNEYPQYFGNIRFAKQATSKIKWKELLKKLFPEFTRRGKILRQIYYRIKFS